MSYEQEKASIEAQTESETRIQRWVSEGQELQKTVNDFNLAKEVENQEFMQRLASGYSVEDAYFLTHKQKILQNASKTAEQNTISNIKAKGKRLVENGTNLTPGVVRKIDVNSLTDKQMIEINKRVLNGEKIQF
jgi:DsbC/DsbD-like thiol-disulfide interchange protein